MKTLIFIIFVLVHSISNAATNIVFINGIDGKLTKSDASASKLFSVLKNANYFDKMGGNDLGISFWYNPGDGLIDDKVELFNQAAISALALPD